MKILKQNSLVSSLVLDKNMLWLLERFTFLIFQRSKNYIQTNRTQRPLASNYTKTIMLKILEKLNLYLQL